MTVVRPDTDYFENRRLGDSGDLTAVRARLRALLTPEATAAEPPADVAGVLAYLASDEEHDSEGRDLSFDKRSFSRTELRVAAGLDAATAVRYLLYRYRFNHYPRHQELSAFPIILCVEPTSSCNLRCTMCFQADPALSEDRHLFGYMDLDLYRRVVDEAAAKGVGGIVLASRGEPLLHHRIGEMIRYAKDAGILDVKLNTNATALSERKARALLESGLDTLVFSVDSANPEQFERIRVGASFDRVVENIQRFHALRRDEYPDAPVRTRVSMVLLSGEQDAQASAEFWAGQVDEFAARWVIPRLGIYDLPAERPDRPCSLLWERLYVWWDGTVNPCDEDYLSRLSPGSVADGTSIESVWTGPVMQRYREVHRRRARGELHPCGSCPGF